MTRSAPLQCHPERSVAELMEPARSRSTCPGVLDRVPLRSTSFGMTRFYSTVSELLRNKSTNSSAVVAAMSASRLRLSFTTRARAPTQTR